MTTSTKRDATPTEGAKGRGSSTSAMSSQVREAGAEATGDSDRRQKENRNRRRRDATGVAKPVATVRAKTSAEKIETTSRRRHLRCATGAEQIENDVDSTKLCYQCDRRRGRANSDNNAPAASANLLAGGENVCQNSLWHWRRAAVLLQSGREGVRKLVLC